jgi:hypothetical protein
VAGFTPAPGLEELVAAMIAPQIHDIAKEVEREAKRLAPPIKTWISMRDGRVRHTHKGTDGQKVPANLRFKIESMEWDREHRGVGPNTYMRFPKDETSRAVVNILNCRCRVQFDKNGIAKHIKAGPAKVEGTKVVSVVSVKGEWVVAAEFGTVYPGQLVAKGNRFMGRAALNVALRSRA